MEERIRTLKKELELEKATEQIGTIEEERLKQIGQQRRLKQVQQKLRALDEKCKPLIIANKNMKAKPAMERRNAWHKLDVWKSGCIAQQRELEVCAQCAAEPFVVIQQ